MINRTELRWPRPAGRHWAWKEEFRQENRFRTEGEAVLIADPTYLAGDTDSGPRKIVARCDPRPIAPTIQLSLPLFEARR